MSVRNTDRRRDARWSIAIDWTLLSVVAALVAHQLLVPPIVGLADQGDYLRIMAPVGLAHVGTTYEDTVFLWVHTLYKAVPRDTSALLPSSELLLAGMARGIDAIVSPDGMFDLRLLGAVHLAGYLLAIWLVLRASRTLPSAARAAVRVGVLLVAPDIVYVAYLNSFYSEPAAIIFLFSLVGVALHELRTDAPSPWGPWLYFLCAALFAFTKVQNYALALPLIGLPVTLLASRAWRRTLPVVLVLGGALLALTLVLFARLPDSQRHPARWNGVFYGLLVDSPSPAEDLAELGLEAELTRWIGVPAIEIDGQWARAPVMEVGARYGLRAIAGFYFRHPDRLIAVAGRCAEYTFTWRNPLLGNYTRASGRPPRSQAPSYTGWSDMERALYPRHLGFLVVFFGAFLAVSAWELRAGLDSATGRTALLATTVATMAILAFAILVVAGGIEDPITDLFMFQVLFDVCLLVSLAWAATRFARLLPAGALRNASVPSGDAEDETRDVRRPPRSDGKG